MKTETPMDSSISPFIESSDLRNNPIETAATIPASWSVSEQFHYFDRQAVLLPSWQYVCHASQVAQLGDQFGCEILGKPVLIVRDMEGTVRAFANVCRHRGGPLAVGKQKGRILRCMYHSWTYNLQGELIGANKTEGIQDFDKTQCSLPVLTCAVEGEMVFVNLSKDCMPLETLFSTISKRVSPIDLTKMHFYHRQVYDVACNWKVYIENYMEGYHIDSIHPELAKILSMKDYKTECDSNWVLQHGPISNNDNPYNAFSGSAFYYYLFPNTMLNILPGRMQINSVIPVTHDSCKVVFDYCYDASYFNKDISKVLEEDLAISDLVQKQDADICKAVQKGLSSGFYERGRYAPREELGLYYFHTLLRKAYLQARS